MFGNKDEKRERLAVLVDQVMLNPGIKAAELARRLGVNRSTVLKDLTVLSEMGIWLSEDEHGGLYVLE